MKGDQFFLLLKDPSVLEAKKFYIKLNQWDEEKLNQFFKKIEEFDSIAYSKLSKKPLNLVTIKKYFKKSNSAFEEIVIDNQIELIKQQEILNRIVGKKLFTDKTLHETIYLSIIFEQKEIASSLKKKFEVTDKK